MTEAVRKKNKRRIKKPEIMELYERTRRMNKQVKDYLREKLYDRAIEQSKRLIEELGGRRLPDTDFAANAEKRIGYCEQMKESELNKLETLFSLIYKLSFDYPRSDFLVNMRRDIFRKLPEGVLNMPKNFYDFIDRAIKKYGLPLREDDVWSRDNRNRNQPILFYTSKEELGEFAEKMGFSIPRVEYV